PARSKDIWARQRLRGCGKKVGGRPCCDRFTSRAERIVGAGRRQRECRVHRGGSIGASGAWLWPRTRLACDAISEIAQRRGEGDQRTSSCASTRGFHPQGFGKQWLADSSQDAR